ncbi:hypothetical protein [Streptomyces griseorubiginosus]|uniref:hypothetical protein n=1 Tax=Streptomyces griseorubiginosus TaxID=67304 RepID=UPI00076C7A6E|nr:hypothetical protein [Streptomyces griseorubiginosus]KUM69547.1 hypothetical protein AQI84_33000 [Streptomyces griseorubiginosus]
MNRKLRTAVLVAVLALLIAPLASFASFAGTAAAAGRPNVELSKSQAGTGGSITVSGSGWRERTLLMILICGQAVPSRGVPGGTNSCANADGRAVTTDAKGGFSRKLPVSEPPVPCPCVVHVATVTGAKAEADVVFQVAGHAVEPLPADTSGGRLSVLTDTALNGSSGLLTWFGAPPARTLVFTVGNVGTSDVRNPVFQVGTAHGVFAPQWDEQQWRGTIRPGGRARIELPVELAAGAHGDYTVSLKYGGKVLAEQPWGVGRPWGVTLFWILVCLVVPAALFRIGMAVVDRVRPRPAGGVRHRGVRLPELALRLPGFKPSTAAHAAPPSTSTLPWFTPDADPGAAGGRLSAPHDDSPTSPPAPTSPATPTREGST